MRRTINLILLLKITEEKMIDALRKFKNYKRSCTQQAESLLKIKLRMMAKVMELCITIGTKLITALKA